MDNAKLIRITYHLFIIFYIGVSMLNYSIIVKDVENYYFFILLIILKPGLVYWVDPRLAESG